MEGALAKVLADRDTQPREIPETTDSAPVVENEVFMDSNDTHTDDTQMNESETVNEYPETQEETNVETQEVDETQETQEESNIDPTTDLEKRLASLEKQRADQQGYYMGQINDLNAKITELTAEKAEPPAKKMTDDEINDLYYENPAEAMRIMQAQAQPQVNTQIQIQEGVQRALHSDYDEVIGIVYKQATLNPTLEQEILSSPDPAKMAYEKGLEFQKALQIQTDPKAYEAELRAKIESELASKQPMPTRVGNARSSAPKVGNASQADHGKTTFDKMFGKQRR